MIDIDIIQANNSTHQEIDQLMIELQEDRINGKIRDTLIFVEHPEIVTIGRRGMLDGLTAPDNFPSSQVDRGGGLTWHGPGPVSYTHLRAHETMHDLVFRLLREKK